MEHKYLPHKLLKLLGIFVQHPDHLYLCLDGTFLPAGSKIFLCLLLMHSVKRQEFHSSPFSFVCVLMTGGNIDEKIPFPLLNVLCSINKMCSR